MALIVLHPEPRGRSDRWDVSHQRPGPAPPGHGHQPPQSCRLQRYREWQSNHEPPTPHMLSLLSDGGIHTHTGRLVCVVCSRRTVNRLSFWLWPSSTSSRCSWCPSTATSWNPTTTRSTTSARSPPGAQVYSRHLYDRKLYREISWAEDKKYLEFLPGCELH